MNNTFYISPQVQQDTAKPQLSPYLRNYFRYLRTVEKDSFFLKKYNLNTHKLIQRDDFSKDDYKLFFTAEPKEVKEEIPVVDNDIQDTVVAENPVDTVKSDTIIKVDSLPELKSGKPNWTHTEINETDQNISLKTEKGIQKFDWFLGVLLFSVIFLAWIRLFFRREMSKYVTSVFNNQTSYKVFLEQNTNTQRASFLLNLLFSINLSFFIYFIVDFYSYKLLDLNKFPLFLTICGIIISVYLLKFVVYKILGFVFMSEKYSNEYLHNVFLFGKVYGIALLPVTIGLSYLPPTYHIYLLWVGYILFAISFLFRIYRGIQISFKAGLSIFYLFLYLCTLEILPFVVLFKHLGLIFQAN